MGTTPEPGQDPNTAEPLTDRERVRLTDEIARLKSALKGQHRDDLEADRIREMAFSLGRAVVDPPKWLVSERAPTGGPGVPMTFWSDWHFGEVVRPEEVGGFNEFNVEIARKRVRTLVERIVDLTHHHMVRPEYPGIVVGLGGDMFSGEIHDELTETNAQSTVESLAELCGVLVWALEDLAERFPSVVVPCVVGNHDRLTERQRYKGAAVNSFAWLLYTMIEARLRDRGQTEDVGGKIRMIIPRGFDCALDVYGHRYLFTHGDRLGVKGGDGIIGSIGPIKRGAIKVAENLRRLRSPVETIVMGHWHTLITLPGLIVNGSLKGYDEYAMGNRFAPEPPCQALWFHHPRHGITCHWPVFLEEARRESPARAVAFAEATA